MSYENFSEVYDTFMNDIPYDKWVDHLFNIWEKYEQSPKLVAELGCGTGNITQRLAKCGLDMIGIDISAEMLVKAQEKNEKSGTNVLYLNQDMCEFELFGTVDSIISLCDSINYITEKEDLLKTFKLVNTYLNPNGLFIFDMNTEYKFSCILSDNCFCQTTQDAAFTWENYYDEDEKINEYYVNFFIKDNKSNKYNRYEEYHYEKAYTIDEIKDLLLKSGLEFLAVYNELSFEPALATSQRICFVARKSIK